MHNSFEGQGPRVAVVGCGRWGSNHVRTFAELGALHAIVDADPDVAAKQGATHNVPARSLESVLDDPRVDAVVVASPATEHARLAVAALKAGKHVLVEKPMAMTVGDAEAVLEAGRAAQRTVMVGHLLQYHPAFSALKQLVDAGELGQLRYLYSHRLNLGQVRQEENSLWSFAPHDISMLLSLIGAEPSKVTAVGASFLTHGVPDVTTTHLEFPGGQHAHVFVSWLHPFKEQRLVAVGSDGMAVFDDLEDWPNKLRLYKHGVDWRDGPPRHLKAEATNVPLVPLEPLRVECEHFLECIDTGSTPLTDGREGIRVLRVLAAAQAELGVGAASPPEGRAGINGSAPAGPAAATVHPSAVVDGDVTLGSGTKVWHFCHVLSGSRIGNDCSLGQNVVVGPGVTVGDRCRIQNNVSVYSGVTLEDGVFCGPSCVFTNVERPRAEVSRADEFLPTLVRTGATIGANATIVCGTTIGSYAFVGAGAVVTGDIPAHALVVGNPARQIGWVSHDGERLEDDLVCPRSGREYRVADDRLLEVTG